MQNYTPFLEFVKVQIFGNTIEISTISKKNNLMVFNFGKCGRLYFSLSNPFCSLSSTFCPEISDGNKCSPSSCEISLRKFGDRKSHSSLSNSADGSGRTLMDPGGPANDSFNDLLTFSGMWMKVDSRI